jgi:hypothetical protein
MLKIAAYHNPTTGKRLLARGRWAHRYRRWDGLAGKPSLHGWREQVVDIAH